MVLQTNLRLGFVVQTFLIPQQKTAKSDIKKEQTVSPNSLYGQGTLTEGEG
jgi:hypothetical protein